MLEQDPPLDVSVLGLGPIGRSVCELAHSRPDMRLVAVADKAPDIAGRSLGELIEGAPGLRVAPSATALLETGPGLVFLCTSSRLAQLLPELEQLLAAGVDICSSAEELACPRRTHPSQAERLDQAARAGGARLLGTGVNPGFVMDVLPVLLAQASGAIRAVEVLRVVDTLTRRAPLRRKTGCGLSREQFASGAAEGRLGHVGLDASAQLIAQGLGLDCDFDERLEPVLAGMEMTTPEGTVEGGQVTGIHQLVDGRSEHGVVIRLELTMAVGAPNPRDEVRIEGDPSLHLTLEDGVAGDIATARRVVNAARPLLSLPPGLHSVLDLPLRGQPLAAG